MKYSVSLVCSKVEIFEYLADKKIKDLSKQTAIM